MRHGLLSHAGNPPPEQSDQHFSLVEVLEVERPAWVNEAENSYHFDGICLWHQRGSRWASVSPKEAPETGWRHRAECNCRLCTKGTS
jgi:hypothetical protein